MKKLSLLVMSLLLFLNLVDAKRSPMIDESKIAAVDTVKWTSIEPLKDHTGYYRIHYIGHDQSDKHIDSSRSYIQFVEDENRDGEIDMLTYTEDSKEFFYGFKVFVKETPDIRVKVLSRYYE